jgi:N-acyl-D-amino-acid deacylase
MSATHLAGGRSAMGAKEVDMAYDLLIKNGRIIDGSGMPSFYGDVGVKDGRIVEIGKLSGPATKTIDAGGLVVSPGFIDNHCHFDAQVSWDPLCTFSPYHGVTTVVFGNCSLSLAPVRPGDEEILLQMLSRVEAIPLDILKANAKWGWNTTAEYLQALDGNLGVNVGSLMGHSAIRRYVMGEPSQERVVATADEIEAMKQVVRDGLTAGALGISYGRNPRHFDERGKPVPAAIAPVEELYELASVLGEMGTGVIQSGSSELLELEEGYCSKLSEISGRPVVYNQIVHRYSAPDRWKDHIAHLERMGKKGLRAHPVINPRSTKVRFTMKNAQLFDGLPTWRPIMAAPHEEKIAAFRDPEVRKQMHIEGIQGVGISDENWSRRWDKMMVAETALEKNSGFIGKSVEEIAHEQGKDILDALLDLVLEEDLETAFDITQVGGDVEAMAEMLRNPYTVIGLSDSGAHLVFNANYGYCTLFLSLWVRERGIMSLEEAVRKLTFMQASLLGMSDRGLLRPGFAADIVIFDPDTVAPLPQELVSDLPGGASRIQELATGIQCTVVNGEVLIENGKHTGALPGQVIRNSYAQTNGY